MIGGLPLQYQSCTNSAKSYLLTERVKSTMLRMVLSWAYPLNCYCEFRKRGIVILARWPPVERGENVLGLSLTIGVGGGGGEEGVSYHLLNSSGLKSRGFIRYENGSKRGSRDILMAMCMRLMNDNGTALEMCGKEGRDGTRHIWAAGGKHKVGISWI